MDLNPQTLLALVSLTAMEVVLGIDNIVFITILAGRLPPERQDQARRIGLTVALVTRLGLLFAISWMMGLTKPLFAVFGHAFTGRDLILLVGGLFLIAKATHEIHDKLEVEHPDERAKQAAQVSFAMVIAQIGLLDIVFSLDSVITAVGMAQQLWVMVAAQLVALAVMLAAAAPIGNFVNRHPSLKMLALSFLLLIGVMLVAEGMGRHVSKGYIYFAMGFSLLVELLNMRMRKTQTRPVALHGRFEHQPLPTSTGTPPAGAAGAL